MLRPKKEREHMSQITKVRALENHQLEAALDNGSSVTLDLKPRLNTLRFAVLKDEALFRRAATDGYVIRWDNKVEISVSELFGLVRK
jgi:hypothetical protein